MMNSGKTIWSLKLFCFEHTREKRKTNTLRFRFFFSPSKHSDHGKSGFVTATKLGTTNKIFVVATKNFAAATKRFAYTTKHFDVVTKYFCCPYLTTDFVGITKPFIPWTSH